MGAKKRFVLVRFWQWLRSTLSGRFLCDTCKYDYRGACDLPKRPNAKSCDDYRHK